MMEFMAVTGLKFNGGVSFRDYYSWFIIIRACCPILMNVGDVDGRRFRVYFARE